MNEKLKDILKKNLNDADYYYSIDRIVIAIENLYREQEQRTIDVKIENKKLEAQVEMKNDLINMYEDIISKSNFNIILEKKKKGGDK